ncbi:MAG: hypothetical protein EBR10_05735 [Planctomycetes bacterium]|nr:hypothetical protein [Planctomycetota bacterium]
MAKSERSNFAARSAFAAALLSIAACDGAPKYRLPDGTAYPYGPEKAEVHRLSRLQAGADGVSNGAAVFIEFRDVDGETCRGIGEMEVALVVSGRQPQTTLVSLDSRSDNSARWNRAVRMYELHFKIDPPLPVDPPPIVRADLKWTCGTRPAVSDSAHLDAPPAQ